MRRHHIVSYRMDSVAVGGNPRFAVAFPSKPVYIYLYLCISSSFSFHLFLLFIFFFFSSSFLLLLLLLLLVRDALPSSPEFRRLHLCFYIPTRGIYRALLPGKRLRFLGCSCAFFLSSFAFLLVFFMGSVFFSENYDIGKSRDGGGRSGIYGAERGAAAAAALDWFIGLGLSLAFGDGNSGWWKYRTGQDSRGGEGWLWQWL
ncbi:hypothetical protein BZA05DRAFT_148786 [Tricharina praecox]|uniref:uncharacterized protein n=1 Tax=Tricharina praecox TaxID=43433 RepID=UPI00221F1C19|nr:uncharacterized protein BZA05DRAFT_148786 [Tricharina praecox]KAI5845365.1 hypothetical protein BZA05DRAFT_148786 [Tricharina praecox]